MAALSKIFLFFFIFTALCFLSAGLFLKKLEAKREELIYLTCRNVQKDGELIKQLLETDKGYETFKDNQFFDFEKNFEELLISQHRTLKVLDETPLDNILPGDCLKLLSQNDRILSKAEKRLKYLSLLKKIYEDFQNSLLFIEEKGFTGFTEGEVAKKRQVAKTLEEELASQESPDQDLRPIKTQFKRTLRAYVELWANTQVALERKTPVIFSSSYRVFKEDLGQLEIDLKKIKVLL